MPSRLLLFPSVLAALVTVAIGQGCPRPLATGSGHPLVVLPAETVTYSDGYRTEGNLMHPDLAVPACGWPLVVFVHRLGSSRSEGLALQRQIAGQGYAVWSYDVRGQGAARGMNPPGIGTTMYGAAEKFDLAEQIAFVRNRYPALLHPDRLAVVGSSQGGVHAWAAAALSETTLTVPGRGTITFPRVHAAVPFDFIAEPTEHRLRGGNLFSSWLITMVADDTVPPFELDAGFRDQVRMAFLAQDPAMLLQAWTAENGRMLAPLLSTSTVPIFYAHAYHDIICSPLPALDDLAGRPASAPARVWLSTIGHNTPGNAYEQAMRDRLIVRWLHRFLWDEDNGVDREAGAVLAALPLDPQQLGDPAYLWGHVYEDDLLAPSYPVRRLYLRGDGSLQEQAPAAAEPSAILDHQVASGYTPPHYLALAANRDLAAVLQAMPLSEQVYALAPLPAAAQVGAAPRVSLQLEATAGPQWCVAALLTAEPPGGSEVMLSSWGVAGSPVAGGQRLEFDLPPTAAVLPSGTVLRLRLRNLWLREAPMARELEVAPLFTPFSLQVHHRPDPQASWIDLPLRPAPTVQLVGDSLYIDMIGTRPVQMTIRGGPERVGRPYFVAASHSGHRPGMMLPGGVLPINRDELTDLFALAVGSPELIAFVGDLDGAGEAHPVLDLSGVNLHPGLLGLPLQFAAWVYAGPTDLTGEPSNPLDLVLR